MSKSDNALSVEKSNKHDLLNLDENASATNNLTDSEITDNVINRTA